MRYVPRISQALLRASGSIGLRPPCISYSNVKQFNRHCEERSDEAIQSSATCNARVMALSTLGKRRGRRECRVTTSPMARLQQKTQAAVPQVKSDQPDIPCAMVLTAYGVRAPARPAFVSPSSADSSSANLAPATRAPGPHALAVRITSHVRRGDRVHCIPRPTSGDDWPNAPLGRGGTVCI
jgi:hypothetical protein